MTPILAVDDPVSAREMLARVFGFVSTGNGCMALGGQDVAVIRAGEAPKRMLRMQLDHVAFATPDADAACANFMARGGHLARAFTPDGPSDIPEFWDKGVRFVFFDGPEGWPVEFCMKKGAPARSGHDHFAVRAAKMETVEDRLVAMGATPVAHHRLRGNDGPVEVSFLARGADMFEVFDEGPFPDPGLAHGWIGFLRT